MRNGHRHIWIDLDNSPQVPFFRPTIGELWERGYSLILTARDAFQVSEISVSIRGGRIDAILSYA